MSMKRQGLAWNQEEGERTRLLRIISIVCPLFLVMTVYISWTDVPEQKREELEALPPQLAKLVLQKKEKPKPVIEKLVKKEEPKPELKKPEKVAEAPKPKPKKPLVAQKPKPKVKPKPQEIELARQKAKTSGLLAMSNELSKLSALANSVKLDTPKTITAKPISRKSPDKLTTVASATTRSAGIDERQLTQESQQLSLASRQVSEIAEAEELVGEVVAEEAAQQAFIAQRTTEEIRRVMDANKSAINSIYNRALRKKPSLQGTLTSQLVIEENGIVSSCSVVESTLNEPSLESKICKRLRLVNFGPKPGVEKTTFSYPIELLPG